MARTKTVLIEDRQGHLVQKTVTIKDPEPYADRQKFVTQAEYDAIPVKDENTLYFILEA